MCEHDIYIDITSVYVTLFICYYYRFKMMSCVNDNDHEKVLKCIYGVRPRSGQLDHHFNPFHIHPLLVNIEHVDVPLVFVLTDHGIFCSIMYADS